MIRQYINILYLGNACFWCDGLLDSFKVVDCNQKVRHEWRQVLKRFGGQGDTELSNTDNSWAAHERRNFRFKKLRSCSEELKRKLSTQITHGEDVAEILARKDNLMKFYLKKLLTVVFTNHLTQETNAKQTTLLDAVDGERVLRARAWSHFRRHYFRQIIENRQERLNLKIKKDLYFGSKTSSKEHLV